MGAFIQGLGFGLVLAVMVGPIFFTILQTSIERGWRSGLVLASGQWLGDFMYIGLVFWGAQYIQGLLDDEASRAAFTDWMGLAGSVLLFGFGLFTAWPRKGAISRQTLQVSTGGMGWLMFQGFSINTLNPFPLFFWSSLMGTSLSAEYSLSEQIWLFTGVMLTVIFTDGLKVYLSLSLSRYIQDYHLRYVRLVAGLALMAFALLLFWRTRA